MSSFSILCVAPSPELESQIRALSTRAPVDIVTCRDTDSACNLLGDSAAYSLILIGDTLAEHAALTLIRTVRESDRHLSVPIAMIVPQDERGWAHQAIESGVTEVFLASDPDALSAFIEDMAVPANSTEFIGKALILEDTESHARYVAMLCQTLGMQADIARDIETATRLFEENRYQILIVDIVLDDTRTGISFVRQIRHAQIQAQPILVISGFDDTPRRLLALKSGADDFLKKPFSAEEFSWRVRKILDNYEQREPTEIKASPKLMKELLEGICHHLSPRERQICEHLLNGRSDREIAESLGISFWTVRGHIQQIFTKTGAINRRDLMARFITT